MVGFKDKTCIKGICKSVKCTTKCITNDSAVLVRLELETVVLITIIREQNDVPKLGRAICVVGE